MSPDIHKSSAPHRTDISHRKAQYLNAVCARALRFRVVRWLREIVWRAPTRTRDTMEVWKARARSILRRQQQGLTTRLGTKGRSFGNPSQSAPGRNHPTCRRALAPSPSCMTCGTGGDGRHIGTVPAQAQGYSRRARARPAHTDTRTLAMVACDSLHSGAALSLSCPNYPDSRPVLSLTPTRTLPHMSPNCSSHSRGASSVPFQTEGSTDPALHQHLLRSFLRGLLQGHLEVVEHRLGLVIASR